MKILNTQQLKEVDQETIQNEGISSWELMERASHMATSAILDDYSEEIKNSSIVVVCGKGNNGGDGLCIARILRESGYPVTICLIKSEDYSAFDAAVLGVYIHGSAGDYAKDWVGETSLVATDIIEHLGSAFMEF